MLEEEENGHHKSQSTKIDILLGVGWQYALCRQVIFLSNAILIGCGMALIAAGFEQRHDLVIEWLGGTWAGVISGFGISCIITTLLGCFGACYEKRLALIIYIIILSLLVLIEVIIVCIIFVQDLKTLLQQRWDNDLSDSFKQDVFDELDCTDFDTCYDQIIGDAQSQLNLIIGIASGIIFYQLVMICFSAQYIKGLKTKMNKKTILKHGGEIVGLTPNQLKAASKSYKYDDKERKHSDRKHSHSSHNHHHHHQSTAVETMGSQEMKSVKWK